VKEMEKREVVAWIESEWILISNLARVRMYAQREWHTVEKLIEGKKC
jgi:hypothetical protein